MSKVPNATDSFLNLKCWNCKKLNIFYSFWLFFLFVITSFVQVFTSCMFLGKHDPSTYKSTPDWGWRKKKAPYCDWGAREVICYYQIQLICIFRAVIKILWPTDHSDFKPRLLSVKPLDQVDTWIGYTVYSPHSVIHPLCMGLMSRFCLTWSKPFSFSFFSQPYN